MGVQFQVYIKSGPAVQITDYVKSISVRRGLGDPMRRIADVGVCTLVVENADRRFTPGYTSSALHPFNVGVPLRVEATYDEGLTTTVVWRGTVRGIEPVAGIWGSREAIIEAVDVLALYQDFNVSIPLQIGIRGDAAIKLIAAARTGEAATGLITWTGTPAANDTITIDGNTYTFVTSLTNDNQIKIATTGYIRESTIDNVVAAINGEVGAGTAYSNTVDRSRNVVVQPNTNAYRRVMAARPVRYYRLDESAGTTAADIGGNGRDGTYVGSPTLGVTSNLADGSKAVTFDGVDDYVSVPSIDLRNRSFTVACWFKVDSGSPPARGAIFGVYSAYTDRQSLYVEYRSTTPVTNTLYVSYYNDDFYLNANTITPGGWYRLVLVYDAVADTTLLYLNGTVQTAFIAAGTTAIGPFEGTNPVITIGADEGAPFNFFKGEIDEWALWLRALSADEVLLLGTNAAAGLYITAGAKGSAGNAITYSENSSVMSAAAATLTGGAESGVTCDPGLRTFDYVGDTWRNYDTNAMSALEQIAQSEYGLIYVNANGDLLFKNADWATIAGNAAAALTLAGEQQGMSGRVSQDLAINRVIVSYTPAGVTTNGVIARANGEIKVPPTPPLQTLDRRRPNTDWSQATVVTIPFIDVASGQIAGALDVDLPLVAGVNFHISDFPNADPDTEKYGNYDRYPWNILVNVSVVGGEIQIALINIATGTLYISDLYVTGTALIRYETAQVVAEDPTEQSTGIRTLTADIPLPASGAQEFAEALAQYLLSVYGEAQYRVDDISFANNDTVAGVELWSLDIGDVIALTEYQTNISAQKHVIIGVDWTWQPGTHRILFALKRLDERAFGVWNTGVWDTALWGL